MTVLVDPVTGLLARADCPVKTKMTYPVGNDPKGHCGAVHPSKADADAGSAEARAKAIAKRVVSPNKWLVSEKEKTDQRNDQER